MKTTHTFKSLLSASALVAATMTAAPSPVLANSSIHGAICTAANLAQALNLGLGLSQFGAANNQPIGGGSFFIVCPINMDTSHTDAGDNDSADFIVGVEFLDALAEDITCSILETDGRVVESSSGGFTFTNNAANTSGIVQDVVHSHGFAFREDAMSIVCAMPPQTRLNFVTAGS